MPPAQMFIIIYDEMGAPSRPAVLCTVIRQLPTYEQKHEAIVSGLCANDKWEMLSHLSEGRTVFPSFDLMTFKSTEIRESANGRGVRQTLSKEWSTENMSKMLQFTHTAFTCEEFYEQLEHEWSCAYGCDYTGPVNDQESVSYGWAVAGVYFNVLDCHRRTCRRTQMFEVGTNKEAPAFIEYEQDSSVLDYVLLYLLS